MTASSPLVIEDGRVEDRPVPIGRGLAVSSRIVGCGGEGECPSDPVHPAQFRPVEARDGLDPAEALLDSLADPLDRGIAGACQVEPPAIHKVSRVAFSCRCFGAT